MDKAHGPVYRLDVMRHTFFGYSRLVLAFAGFAMLVLLLTGCGREVLDAGYEDEMVMFSETSRIRSLDPIKAGDVPSAHAIARIYEGLLEYHYLDRPYRVVPLLAEELPEISEDGLTYTFRIRRGIYFQDDPCFVETGGKGRELVAEDFIYSIKRVADVRNASTGYWVFRDRIVGLDDFRETTMGEGEVDYDMDVEGLQAPDPHTLVITLTEPYPQLLHILTMHYAHAVPREAVEYYGKDFINNPVGTGPYILESWQRNYRIEFVRNPKWEETGRIERYPTTGAPGDEEEGLLADAGKPIPFIDRVIQYKVGDPSTQWLMFLRGQFESSGISRDNWDAVLTEAHELNEDLIALGIQLRSSPAMFLTYIGFNMDDPVVGLSSDPDRDRRNRKLRQALAHAFDYEEWIEFQNQRIRKPTGPIPPGVAGYVERDVPYPFDLERARELLEEAGYPGGRDPETGRRLQLTLEIGAADAPDVRQGVELLAQFMDRIGIVINPSYNHWPAFLEKLSRGQAQMFQLGWVADYPDAENFLQLFYGPNRSPGPNHAQYANSDYDRLYEEFRTMLDSPERTELAQRMADIVIEDSPWLFTGIPVLYGVFHSWLENFKRHDFPYGMSKYYKIDVDHRREWQAMYGQ